MGDGFFESDPRRMSLDRLLSTTGQALRRSSERALAAHGLTSTSWGVLGVLAQVDDLSHRELSGRLGVAPATLTPAVDALEAAAELRRERDPSDRRVVRLSITPQGRDRLAVALEGLEATVRSRLPRASSSDAEIIRRYLLAVLAVAHDEQRIPPA